MSIAGCLDDSPDADDTGDDPPEDADDEDEPLAIDGPEDVADEIAAAFELAADEEHPGWDVREDTFEVRYYEEAGDPEDTEAVAQIDADVIAGGFDIVGEFTAVDRDEGTDSYVFTIEIEWAKAYNDGELSGADSYDTIAETMT